ncbi:SecDF P1 head subdomain-containing protein [Streptomyces sp. NPDC088354]|uniref:SecDF P1 head subdomain-containing protein n=1 Tax=Streptomyces sp. NPDC088354 TaxID=3365856 RepID=UPI003806C77A
MAEHRRRTAALALLLGCASALAACSPAGHSAADKGGDGPRTTAVFTPRRPLGEERLRQTADLMRRRAEGFGLRDVEVRAAGGKVTVSARGAASQQLAAEQLASLGRPAVLVLRPVVAVAPAADEGPSAPAGAGAAEFRALDCSVAAGRTDHQRGDGERAVACATDVADGVRSKYLLDPVALNGTEISSAEAVFDRQDGTGWQIQLRLTAAGARTFQDVTGRLAGRTSPTNQFAMVLDGAVLSAPAVNQAIPGGTAVITGNFTRASAGLLAAQISGGSLPTPMDVSSMTR